MANNRMVYHDGEVIRVGPGNQVKIKIISQSACADCHAKAGCSAADMDEKIIEAQTEESLVIGDEVRVVMAARLGWKAVNLGFIFPLVVMAGGLFISSALGVGDVYSSLIGLGCLFPYFVFLYLFRSRIEKDFVFRAEKKNKY